MQTSSPVVPLKARLPVTISKQDKAKSENRSLRASSFSPLYLLGRHVENAVPARTLPGLCSGVRSPSDPAWEAASPFTLRF